MHLCEDDPDEGTTDAVVKCPTGVMISRAAVGLLKHSLSSNTQRFQSGMKNRNQGWLLLLGLAPDCYGSNDSFNDHNSFSLNTAK